jgi:hypothetical protein
MLYLNVVFGWCRKTAEHCGVAGPEYPDQLQVCGGQPLRSEGRQHLRRRIH